MFRSVFLKDDFGCSVEDKLKECKRNQARYGNCIKGFRLRDGDGQEKPVMGDQWRSDLWIEWLEFRRWRDIRSIKKREVRWQCRVLTWATSRVALVKQWWDNGNPSEKTLGFPFWTSTLRYLFCTKTLGVNPEDTRLEFRARSGWRYKSIPFFKLGHYLFIFNLFF